MPSSDDDDDEDSDTEKVHTYNLDKYHSTYRLLVYFTQKYAFWTFATTFLLFVLIYWIWLLWSSEYFNWNPSSIYNSVLEENSDEDRDYSNQYRYHFSEEFEDFSSLQNPEVENLLKLDEAKLNAMNQQQNATSDPE